MRKYLFLFTLLLLLVFLVTLRILLPVATISPAHSSSTWKPLTSFSGHDSLRTATFTVPRHWRLSWRCTGYDDGIAGSFGAVPHEAHGLLGVVARGSCAANAVSSGYTDESRAGTYSLTVFAAGNWWTATVEIPASSP